MGSGTRNLGGGGEYTNNDKYSLAVPEAGAEGKLNITVSSVETHVDPDPLNDGCWTKRQEWSGSGVVPATFNVQSNVGGKNYIVNVQALAPIQVTVKTENGGMTGGESCSEGDTENEQSFSPWVNIHSSQNPQPSFRNGRNVTTRSTDVTCQVVSECSEFPSFNHHPAVIVSQWSIAAKECTGYSKSYRLGKQDTLMVFNPCQTKSLSSRVNFLQEVSGTPKICKFAFAKRWSQACNGYKAVTRIQWTQVDWFMSAAQRTDACGVWVVDRADWRPPKVKPAAGTDGLDVAWIPYGGSRWFKTAEGSIKVGCP